MRGDRKNRVGNVALGNFDFICNLCFFTVLRRVKELRLGSKIILGKLAGKAEARMYIIRGVVMRTSKLPLLGCEKGRKEGHQRTNEEL